MCGVGDGSGASSSSVATVTIFGANDAPTASSASDVTNEDGPDTLIGNVLLDGAAVTDSGDTLTILSRSTAGTVGSVSEDTGGGGYFLYSAVGAFESLALGESTTDTFTYVVTDGMGGSSTGVVTVTITGANAAPVATGLGSSSSTAFAAATDYPTINVLEFGSSDEDASDTLTVASFDTVSGAGAAVSDATGTAGVLSYNAGSVFASLASGESTTDTFAYVVSDGKGGSAVGTLTVVVTGTNDAPVATDSTGSTANEDGVGEATVGVLDFESDVDVSDSLTVVRVDTSNTRLALCHAGL